MVIRYTDDEWLAMGFDPPNRSTIHDVEGRQVTISSRWAGKGQAHRPVRLYWPDDATDEHRAAINRLIDDEVAAGRTVYSIEMALTA